MNKDRSRPSTLGRLKRTVVAKCVQACVYLTTISPIQHGPDLDHPGVACFFGPHQILSDVTTEATRQFINTDGRALMAPRAGGQPRVHQYAVTLALFGEFRQGGESTSWRQFIDYAG